MFPEDPNYRHSSRRHKDISKRKWKSIERLSIVITFILSGIGLFISLKSYQVSQNAYASALSQYNENSKSSAYQFDTLSKILDNYQIIYKNLLATSRIHLSETKAMLQQEIKINKPVLNIESGNWYVDKLASIYSFKSFVRISFINAGKRPLQLSKAFLIVVDKGNSYAPDSLPNINRYIDNNSLSIVFRTKEVLNNACNFFLRCTYSDPLTKEMIVKDFYLGVKLRPESSDPDYEYNPMDNGYSGYSGYNEYDDNSGELDIDLSARTIDYIQSCLGVY